MRLILAQHECWSLAIQDKWQKSNKSCSSSLDFHFTSSGCLHKWMLHIDLVLTKNFMRNLTKWPIIFLFFEFIFCRFELKKLLTLYKGLVEFIEGSPVYQDDLERICASKASAIFLLANKDTNVCANPNTTHAYDIKIKINTFFNAKIKRVIFSSLHKREPINFSLNFRGLLNRSHSLLKQSQSCIVQ